MKTLSRTLSWILLTALLLACFPALAANAAATKTEGIYSYTVSGGKATITAVDESAAGALVTPTALGGCPVTAIGDRAFYCRENITSVTVSEGVTSIADGAFRCCTNLTSISLPDSLRTIGSAVFGMSGLTSITIPAGVTEMGGDQFWDCLDLKTADIQAQIPELGSNMFFHCRSLTSVTLPDSIRTIGMAAFFGCYSLKTIDLPSQLETIGAHAFGACDSMKSLSLPSSLTTINEVAFSGMTSLKSLTIPASVTSITFRLFDDSTSLTDLYCQAAAKPSGWHDDWALVYKTVSGQKVYTDVRIHWGCTCSAPTVTAKTSPDGIQVKWTSSGSCAGYQLFRYAGGKWTKLVTQTGRSFTDPDVTPGVAYRYRVRAYTPGYYGDYGTSSSVMLLDPPSILSTTNYASGLKVTWSSVPGATIYYVWRAEGNGDFVKIGSSRSTSFVDKTAESGAAYRYQIKARYSDSYSQPSAAVKSVRLVSPVLSVKAYASGIKVMWETVPGATLYNIYRKAPGGTYEKIGTSRSLAYVDRSVTSGVKYSYTVVAQVSSFTSAGSKAVSATAR